MTHCNRCGRKINQDERREFIEDNVPLVDLCGMEALTDAEQAVVDGFLCVDCYDEDDE